MGEPGESEGAGRRLACAAALRGALVGIGLAVARGVYGWPWIGVLAGLMVLVRASAGPRPGRLRLAETLLVGWTLAFVGSAAAFFNGVHQRALASGDWSDAQRAVQEAWAALSVPAASDPLRPMFAPWYDLWLWVDDGGCLPAVCCTLATVFCGALALDLLRAGPWPRVAKALAQPGAGVFGYGAVFVLAQISSCALGPPGVPAEHRFTSAQGLEEGLHMGASLMVGVVGLGAIDSLVARLLPPLPPAEVPLEPGGPRWGRVAAALVLLGGAFTALSLAPSRYQPPVVSGWIAELGSQAAPVRSQALAALDLDAVALGTAWPAVLPLLDDPDPGLRASAARVLCKTTAEEWEVVQALAARLPREPEAAVRLELVKTLHALLGWSSFHVPFARWARDLGAAERLLPPLVRDDPSLEVRAEALRTLEVCLPLPALALELVLASLRAPEPELRRAALQVLDRLEPAQAREAVPDLLAALPDPETGPEAGRILGKAGGDPDQVVPALVAAYRRAGGWGYVQGLRDLGAAAAPAVPALVEGYRRRPDERELLNYVFRELGPAAREAVPVLLEALRARPRWPDGGVLEALGAIGDPRAVPDLEAALSAISDGYPRERVLEALEACRP